MNKVGSILSRCKRFLKSEPRGAPTDSKWFKTRFYGSLPQALEIQVNNLLKESFGNGIERDRYFSIPYAHLLAIERGEVIGVAKLFKRHIVFNNKKLTLGGIGCLTTQNEKRRKGVATALLKKAMDDFRTRNFDIAFLCTDLKNPAMIELYSRVGFAPLGKPYAYTGESGGQYVENNGMVAPIKSENKFKSVLSGKEVLNIGLGCW